MARNYVPLKQIITDFLLSMDGSDWASHVSDVAIRNFALRGIREMGFDLSKVVRSLKLSVEANGTVVLPEDYVDWTKVGVIGGDGLVYVLGENKNINYSQSYADASGDPVGTAAEASDVDGDGFLDRVDAKSGSASGVAGLGEYVFRNYTYGGVPGQLYGLGGGQYAGEFRINLDQNRIELKTNASHSELVIEYVADEARSVNPQVHAYLEEALIAYLYYKSIERKSTVPSAEKMRARQEYYNERRKANARMKSFTKEEALKTIRKNYKQSPKA
tara:strand:+ start:510 stop:1331 length:822 start_codon:yes stop_codon:yes gene_type:complete